MRGKIDGINVEAKCIVEIKTRNKSLDMRKESITQKEKLQALTYMKLFDCEECWIVEADKDAKQKINKITWSMVEFEQKILKKLNGFCEYARALNEQEFIQLLKK